MGDFTEEINSQRKQLALRKFLIPSKLPLMKYQANLEKKETFVPILPT